MARSLELLDQLVAALPESLKPIFSHLSGIVMLTQVAFDAHVADNESIFNQVQDQLTSQADRILAVESWSGRAAKQGTDIRERVDKLESRAGTPRRFRSMINYLVQHHQNL